MARVPGLSTGLRPTIPLWNRSRHPEKISRRPHSVYGIGQTFTLPPFRPRVSCKKRPPEGHGRRTRVPWSIPEGESRGYRNTPVPREGGRGQGIGGRGMGARTGPGPQPAFATRYSVSSVTVEGRSVSMGPGAPVRPYPAGTCNPGWIRDFRSSGRLASVGGIMHFSRSFALPRGASHVDFPPLVRVRRYFYRKNPFMVIFRAKLDFRTRFSFGGSIPIILLFQPLSN